MNIEQAIKIASENNGTLIGFHSIPLPVYQVLLDYDTIDDDPFFPIQKAILQYVDKLAHIEKEKGLQWSFNYLAAMLGLDVPLIIEIYKDLIDRHLINHSPENEQLTVTSYARKAYLMGGSRPYKRLTGRILVDGKSFELFPHEIYETILSCGDEVWPSEHTSNFTSHFPIDLSQKDSTPEMLNLISVLNRHQRTLMSIGLEHSEGNNFEITGLEKKFLYGVYLVYIQASDGSLKKIPYIGHTSMKSASLSNINTYMFSLKEENQKNQTEVILTVNLGYNSNEDSKYKSIEGTEKCWITLIATIYEVPEEYAKCAIKTDQYGNKYIFTDEDLLINSSNPSKLLDDILKPTPRRCITLGRKKTNENGVLLVRIEFDNSLRPYVEIKKAINNEANIGQLKKQLLQIAPKDWRQRLVAIGQYSILEEIDCQQYIDPLQ